MIKVADLIEWAQAHAIGRSVSYIVLDRIVRDMDKSANVRGFEGEKDEAK